MSTHYLPQKYDVNPSWYDTGYGVRWRIEVADEGFNSEGSYDIFLSLICENLGTVESNINTAGAIYWSIDGEKADDDIIFSRGDYPLNSGKSPVRFPRIKVTLPSTTSQSITIEAHFQLGASGLFPGASQTQSGTITLRDFGQTEEPEKPTAPDTPEYRMNIKYYSNYADYCEKSDNPVSSSKNVLVFGDDYIRAYSLSNLMDYSRRSEPYYRHMTRTGYTATGYWGTSPTGGILISETEYLTGQELAERCGLDLSDGDKTISLYAQWKPNEYKLKINPNGGKINGTSSTITESTNLIYDSGNLANIPVATREGYELLGYYTEKSNGTKVYDASGVYVNGTSYWKNGKYVYDGNLTVYAQWTPNQYTLSLDANGGTVDIDSLVLTYGTNSNSNIGDHLPFKPRYEFLGWYSAPTGGIQVYDKNGICTNDGTYWRDTTWVYTNDCTLYAQWRMANIAYYKLNGEWALCNTYVKEKGTWKAAIIKNIEKE